MKNVLILSAGYCGKATANGLCAQSLAKGLTDKNLNVYVVSIDNESVDKSLPDNVVSIHNSPIPERSFSTNIVAKGYRFLKNRILHSWTPKYDKNLVKRIVECAEKIIEKNTIDAVVAMYFPLATVVAGYELKRKFTNLKFMIYELDSVADGIGGKIRHGRTLLFAYKRFLGEIYKKVDKILVLKCHTKHWVYEHPKHAGRMNEVDLPILTESNMNKTNLENGSIRFVYSGALATSYRSPEKMLETFGLMKERINWRLDFYSKGCEAILDEAVKQNPSIYSHGYIEQSKLEREISNCDVLLSIGNAYSNSLPSKIITYMTYCKPIIHFSLQKWDVCNEYLSKYPLSLIIPSDCNAEQAAEMITAFLSNIKGIGVSFDELCRLFPMNLPSHSSEIICNALVSKVGEK